MKRKVQYLERDIEKLEKQIAECQNKMIDPDFYKDPSSNEILVLHSNLKSELNKKIDEWEQLVLELDEIE